MAQHAAFSTWIRRLSPRILIPIGFLVVAAAGLVLWGNPGAEPELYGITEIVPLSSGWQVLGSDRPIGPSEALLRGLGCSRRFSLDNVVRQMPVIALEVVSAPRPVEVTLNGQRLGRHTGGEGTTSFSIPNQGLSEENSMVVRPVPPEDSVDVLSPIRPSLDSTTFVAQLRFAPLVRLTAIQNEPSETPGTAVLKVVTANAPPNVRLELTLVRDGQRLMAQEAVLNDNSAVRFKVDIPDALRWSPGEGRVPLVWAVATLRDADGAVLDRLAQRVGFASVRLTEDSFAVNGRDTRLWAIKLEHLGFDHRQLLAGLAPQLRTAGLNAIEAHGFFPDVSLIEAAEELGIFIVVMPRCAAHAPPSYSGQVPPEVEPALERFLALEITRLEASPALLMWERETRWLPMPGVVKPVANIGPKPLGAAQVPVAGAISRVIALNNGTNRSELEVDGGGQLPGRRWIIEVRPEVADRRRLVSAATANRFMKEWRATGALGMVLPLVDFDTDFVNLPGTTVQALGSGRQQDIARIPADHGATRGPARVRTVVLRAGIPVPGLMVALELEGLPTMWALTDDEGVAVHEVWWKGLGVVEAAGQTREVMLEPGEYRDGRWRPNTVDVGLALVE